MGPLCTNNVLQRSRQLAIKLNNISLIYGSRTQKKLTLDHLASLSVDSGCSQKMYDRKHQILEITGDVADADQATKELSPPYAQTIFCKEVDWSNTHNIFAIITFPFTNRYPDLISAINHYFGGHKSVTP